MESSGQLKQREEEEAAFAYATQLVGYTVLPMVLHAAVELGVFGIIAGSGDGVQLSPSQIASHFPAGNKDAPAMLDRMLRLLACYKVLTCTVVEDAETGEATRLYGLTLAAKYFVPNEDGASIGPVLALVQDKVYLNSWYELKGAVIEGGVPFDRVYGMHAFEYPSTDYRFNDLFNKAMFNQTTLVIGGILRCYKGFKGINTIVDVGGGLGVTASIITSKYPHIKAINFDLPHVVSHAPSYPGVEHVGGDMFESIPKADAIFMKWILHDWSDEQCTKLLGRCYDALPMNGKVIVVEGILPAQPEVSPEVISITQSDLIMMIQNPGGRERSEKEFRDLAASAGFRAFTIAAYASTFWILEFWK